MTTVVERVCAFGASVMSSGDFTVENAATDKRETVRD